MGRKFFYSVMAVLLFSAGCAVPQKQAKVVSIEKLGSYVITYPTELRGTYFKEKNSSVYYCAEPAPDVALETLQKLASELSAKLPAGEEVKGKFDIELSNKVVQLAGRTELILLAREMLYRACELTFNDPTKTEKALDMYMRVAELIENLGRADRALAEAELLKVSFGEDKNSQCIQNWIDQEAGNIETLKKWLKDNAGGISIAMFIHGKDFAEKRMQFVREKNIKCD